MTTNLVQDAKFDFHHMSASHLLVMVALLAVLLHNRPWKHAVKKQGKTWALGTSPPKKVISIILVRGLGPSPLIMEMAKLIFSCKTYQVKTKCQVWLCPRYWFRSNEECYVLKIFESTLWRHRMKTFLLNISRMVSGNERIEHARTLFWKEVQT